MVCKSRYVQNERKHFKKAGNLVNSARIDLDFPVDKTNLIARVGSLTKRVPKCY